MKREVGQMTIWTKFAVVLAVLAAIVTVLAATEASALDPASSLSSAVALTKGEAEAMAVDLSRTYSTVLLVPAAAFRSDGINPDQLRFGASGGILQGQNSENAFAVAPIYLPDGATISTIMASVFDGLDISGVGCEEASQQDVSVWVFRIKNSTADPSQMAFFATTGLDEDIQHFLETSVDYPTIEYPEYAYYAVVRLCHSAHAFYNLQIWYGMD